MLKEINVNEINDYPPESILVLRGDFCYTLQEFLETGRFLVDFEDPEEDDQDTEPEEDEEEEQQTRPTERRKKKEIDEMIRQAKADGFTNAFAISKQTGISYKTVRRHLNRLEEDEE